MVVATRHQMRHPPPLPLPIRFAFIIWASTWAPTVGVWAILVWRKKWCCNVSCPDGECSNLPRRAHHNNNRLRKYFPSHHAHIHTHTHTQSHNAHKSPHITTIPLSLASNISLPFLPASPSPFPFGCVFFLLFPVSLFFPPLFCLIPPVFRSYLSCSLIPSFLSPLPRALASQRFYILL